MAPAGFHPLVAQWFRDAIGEPTAVQLRGWSAIGEGRHTLIAAPTGSGKTLAAFLAAIDDLVQEGLAGSLPDEVRVLYVSPLKALSADIHRNLAAPRHGIAGLADAAGIGLSPITVAVRTGDTTASERAAMLRTPPHILVTTPESLYLLLTSARSRELLRTVRTVIVDEIHAVIGTRRGAHLALSLERLQQVADKSPQRIGLSATQNPVEEVARFLTGAGLDRSECVVIDEGHRRTLDLDVEVPRSPLSAVMSNEVWEEYYDRLAELIGQHTTTIVFVNTRKMAERVARSLSERIGEEAVTAHHGSLSKESRRDAEHRLKTGALKALVATASLELGIDIGHVDLVCQIGSPHRIATLLQRVGRSGHTLTGTPKGRMLPVTRDDLVECAALLRAIRHGTLDRIPMHDAPLDVLAQQITAEVACRDCAEDDLFSLVRAAWPYRHLARTDFDAVVRMVAEGFATRRGRRAALVHRDEVHAILRARRGSRMLALTSGGAIPELADYRVVLEPDETFIGTLNEDFAIESNGGDIFQLGNASWRITQVVAGTVRVVDAQGAPPTIPFWLGEAPARSDELSRAVSDLRTDVDDRLARVTGAPDQSGIVDWFRAETGICTAGAEQAVGYLSEGRRTLGVIPTQHTLVLERFFDQSGGMQLVLHAPFGSRINRAWALALRKRFCRQFNFELQAAATEDALLLSLGPQHSFPLTDVFRYLHAATVRDILVQAFLDAPLFQTRWRWSTTISMAVPRYRGGRKVPPPLQRMQAADLMAAVFPDAAACIENIPGDRQVPDHPLVHQTVRDCLEEAMDLPGLQAVLARIHAGALACVGRDTPEPSAFADDILNARPYAFLDDAPLEERRVQAVQRRVQSVQRRRASGDTADICALDRAAIDRVRDEQRPDPRDPDELHDALLTVGVLHSEEVDIALAAMLAATRRATCVTLLDDDRAIWVAAERLPELIAVHPGAVLNPPVAVPPSRTHHSWTRADALTDLLRGRLTILGPTTAGALSRSLAVSEAEIESALLALEADGAILRGIFTPGTETLEWCARGLLARIHRYTLNHLRAEIAPVSAAGFMRFLLKWQHVDPTDALTGIDGLRTVLAQLDGIELPARAWERHVLPARVARYEPALLDTLCLTGEAGWARLSSGPTQVVSATPIAVFLREHAAAWRALEAGTRPDANTKPVNSPAEATMTDTARHVLDHLRTAGACFGHELAKAAGLSPDQVQIALADLVAAGLATSDGFAGLRAIVASRAHGPARAARAEAAGRWSAPAIVSPSVAERNDAVHAFAWTLLRRYGVVFRRIVTREATSVPWRELARVYRTLEARGDIRGGRFVAGMSGEQFALPDAVTALREIRRSNVDERLITISAADPLNLTGIITPGERIRAAAGSRIVYRGGVPVAVMEGDLLRMLGEVEPAAAPAVAAAAAGRRVPVVSGYVGRR